MNWPRICKRLESNPKTLDFYSSTKFNPQVFNDTNTTFQISNKITRSKSILLKNQTMAEKERDRRGDWDWGIVPLVSE